jgi:hypothetical protein
MQWYDIMNDASHPSQPIAAPATITRTGDAAVIVAGGGPVGLCVALLLAEQAIPVTVVEAEPDIVRDLRASTFHPPTLDMLEPLSITAVLLQRPAMSALANQTPSSGDRAVFDLSVLAEKPSPFSIAMRAMEAQRCSTTPPVTDARCDSRAAWEGRGSGIGSRRDRNRGRRETLAHATFVTARAAPCAGAWAFRSRA